MLLHPFLTLAAIVLTANHYWMDAFAALVLFAIALTFDHFWERSRNRRIARRASARAASESTATAALSPRAGPEDAGTVAPGSRTTPACRD